ncbi:transporter substrate-binding domain-containing protein [Granulosicoccaceae sp. 1_MG-2023]|nr:transporter substrate-binding domain-containing protein [Granulosicoccaceae sp. 1_MG-2023]
MTLLSRSTRPFKRCLLGATIALSSLSANAGFLESDKLIASADLTFYPYEYMDNGEQAGFDVEFLHGLSKVMGREGVMIDTRFPNLIPGLRGKRFDILLSSMYITEERMKVIDMIPYLKSGESIMIRSDSSYRPEEPKSFCGHTIGAVAATAGLQNVEKLSEEYCLGNGLEPITFRTFPTDPEATQALLSGAVEAQITNNAVAIGVVEKLGADRVMISSSELLFPVLNGIGVLKDNTEVKEALIEGIAKFRQTAEYAELMEKYQFVAPTPEEIEDMMP